jgi:transposase-like protein
MLLSENKTVEFCNSPGYTARMTSAHDKEVNLSEGDCLDILVSIIWNNGPQCPYCSSRRHSLRDKGRRYHCNSCNLAYSVTTQTIFHNTRIGLDKWFNAIKFLLNSRSSIGARKLAFLIGVNKDTACRIKQSIKSAQLNEKTRLLLLQISERLDQLGTHSRRRNNHDFH